MDSGEDRQRLLDCLSRLYAEPPDPERYIPTGMIRLVPRPEVGEDGTPRIEWFTPTGERVDPTLPDVEFMMVYNEAGEPTGSIRWCTPGAVARPAEGHVARTRETDDSSGRHG